MKILFLGTPAFAVPSLKRLAHTHHRIIAVLTRPDRPRGRGMKLSPPPAKTAALELGLSIIQPDKVASTSTLEKLRELKPDAAAVVAYGRILKRDFLDLPHFGCINLHPSLLPRYRGPTPIQSAIMDGERKTGVTTMLLDEGMDTGNILLQQEVEIAEEDTAGTLHDTLADVGAGLMVRTLDAVEAHEVIPQQQDEAKATVTRKIGKEEAKIDWTCSTGKIRDLTRAMDPWPGSHTAFRGETLKVWKVKPFGESVRTGKPGEILKTGGNRLIVQAGNGAVEILELQAPGGKRMSAGEFTRGHRIEEGTVLGG